MSCNETKSSWKLVEDVWSPNSFMEDNIKIFKRPGANYMAYKINRYAINSNEIIYENEYKPLENSFGIYFLYKRENIQIDKKKYKTVTHIYVGRTSGSSSAGGMKRLVQHVLNDELDGKSYADKWDRALFVCLADDNGFNLGEIAAIEQVFIELFRGLDKNTNYPDSLVSIICHNRKVGDRNNTPVQDYKAHVEAIKDLLINDSIGMIHPDIKGVYLSETRSALSQSVSNEVLNRQYELQDALEKAKRQLKEQNIELEQYRNRSGKRFGLSDIKKLENEFKASYFKSLDTYEKNLPNIREERIYTQADLFYGKKSSEVVTPDWIADDIVKLIPDEDITEDTKFLCMYSKNGTFASALLRKIAYYLSEKSSLYNMDTVKRIRHFIEEQLYIVVPNSECYNASMHIFMDNLRMRFELRYNGRDPLDPNWKDHIENFVTPHIVEIHNMQTLVKSTAGMKYIQERIEEEFKTVKFDVVIGNPPYNNDLYLDFVFLGYKLASKYVCMITPAKWQAKGGIKNETFRKEIVPHMSKIVYYPEEGDAFNNGKDSLIRSTGGITYYLIEMNKFNIKQIVNKSDRVKVFNSQEYRQFNSSCYPYPTLYNIGQHIVDKLNVNKSLDLNITDISNRWKVALNTQVIYWGSAEAKWFFSPEGKTIVLSEPKIFDSCNGEKLTVGAAKYVFSSDNICEISNFCSYINTKLVRFLVLIGNEVLTGVTNKEFWRFVPDPGPFDHIFTDDELYKKYNLTKEEINIIESVIKERKQK